MENQLKKCTITGIAYPKSEYYKSGVYPYCKFAELFRSKHNIPVDELKEFVATLKEGLLT